MHLILEKIHLPNARKHPFNGGKDASNAILVLNKKTVNLKNIKRFVG